MSLTVLGAGRARVLQHAAAVDPQHNFCGLVSLPFDSRFQTLGGPAGHYVHLKIHDQDDHEREVKGEEGGEERVTRLLCDPAHGLMLGRRFLPSQEGTHGDHRGGHPDKHQNNNCPPLGHNARVFQAVFYSDVPVYGDDAEAQDGGGAAEHIHSCPDVAENPAEHPASQHFQGCGEGQHDDAQQQVCHCQVDDEEVCDVLQVFVAHYGQDDQNIPDDGHQNENGEEDPGADDLRVHGEVTAFRDVVVEKDMLQSGHVERFKIQPIVAFIPQVRVSHFSP